MDMNIEKAADQNRIEKMTFSHNGMADSAWSARQYRYMLPTIYIRGNRMNINFIDIRQSVNMNYLMVSPSYAGRIPSGSSDMSFSWL